jgi:hypothetical protein
MKKIYRQEEIKYSINYILNNNIGHPLQEMMTLFKSECYLLIKKASNHNKTIENFLDTKTKDIFDTYTKQVQMRLKIDLESIKISKAIMKTISYNLKNFENKIKKYMNIFDIELKDSIDTLFENETKNISNKFEHIIDIQDKAKLLENLNITKPIYSKIYSKANNFNIEYTEEAFIKNKEKIEILFNLLSDTKFLEEVKITSI